MVAYASDASGQFNVWIQPAAGGPALQLTDFTSESVRELAWAPDGRRIVFTADTCGDELTQIYLVDTGGGAPVQLSGAPSSRHTIAEVTPFDQAGRHLLCGSNDQEPAVPGLIVYDLSGRPCLRWPGVPGLVVYPVAFSPDGRWLLAGAYGASTDYRAYLADLSAPGSALRPVTGHLPGSFSDPGPWDPDSTGFYLRTTATGSGHACLARLSLPGLTLTVVDSPEWDVEHIAISGDGRTLAWSVNTDGRSVLHAQRDGTGIPVPPIPDGVVEAIRISPGGTTAALLLDTPGRPLEVAIADLAAPGPIRYLTDNRPSAVRVSEPVTPALIRYPSADSTPIPGLLYRPAGDGPHPVVVSIHGGPHAQSRPAYDALSQYLLASGVAIFAPNVRGSSGYGPAWQERIHRDWGGIDLTDFAAAAAYLRELDWVDAGRLAVYGKSYGGFATLSCVSRLPDLWAAGVSVCGPANLETLARSMPPDWATTVYTMFGDPDETAAELRERSPVSYAGQITAPLLIVQGATDPRVPKAEADQIVDEARANGVDVTYMVFPDEGHGFNSRDNDLRAYTAVAEFFVRHLT